MARPSYGSPAGAYETIEVKVPDIGDFKNVPVIEILVKEGDEISAEDPLMTLESDKATMEIPSPAAGTVAGFKIKVGDRVSQGDAIMTLRTQAAGQGQRRRHDDAAADRRPALRRASRPAPWPATSTPRCWCWAPGRAATPPPSGRRTWASRWC